MAASQGSARQPYTVKHIAGVYSCSCPAWRKQSLPIDRRSCKHIRSIRGDSAEAARLGTTLADLATRSKPVVKAPALLLAENWQESVDLRGWSLSEKLDGVRSYWDGHEDAARA